MVGGEDPKMRKKKRKKILVGAIDNPLHLHRNGGRPPRRRRLLNRSADSTALIFVVS